MVTWGIVVAVGTMAFVAGFLVGDATRPVKTVEKAPDVATLLRWRTAQGRAVDEAVQALPCALGLTTCPRFKATDAAQCIVNAALALDELAQKLRTVELPMPAADLPFRDAHGRFTKART